MQKPTETELWAFFFGITLGITVICVGRGVIWWGYAPATLCGVWAFREYVKGKSKP